MDDPMESAMNATLAPRSLFGQVGVDTWFCVLVKGQGKVPFDDGQHGRDERRTAIDISIVPLAGSTREARPVRREMIAESQEWVKIVMPSLRALGTTLAGIRDRWVQVQFVPSGRKYTDKNSGETKDATTLKFCNIYADEATCRAAWEAERGAGWQTQQTAPAQQAAAAPAANPERDAAYQFLKVLVNMHGADRNVLATQIAGLPQVAKYFTVDSPETQELLRARAA